MVGNSDDDLVKGSEEHGNALDRDCSRIEELRQRLNGSASNSDKAQEIQLRLITELSNGFTRHLPAYRKDLTHGLRCLRDTKAAVDHVDHTIHDKPYGLEARITALQVQCAGQDRLLKVLVAIATASLAGVIGQLARLYLEW